VSSVFWLIIAALLALAGWLARLAARRLGVMAGVAAFTVAALAVALLVLRVIAWGFSPP
jgi:hypothetical protein